MVLWVLSKYSFWHFQFGDLFSEPNYNSEAGELFQSRWKPCRDSNFRQSDAELYETKISLLAHPSRLAHVIGLLYSMYCTTLKSLL